MLNGIEIEINWSELQEQLNALEIAIINAEDYEIEAGLASIRGLLQNIQQKGIQQYGKGTVFKSDFEQQWTDTFYPRSADEIRGGLSAIDHSIKKWEGALASNLKKYNLDKAPLVFDGDNCALCFHYQEDDCTACPLFLARGRVNCFETTKREKISPFHSYTTHNDPRPMLRWLRKTRKLFVEGKLDKDK